LTTIVVGEGEHQIDRNILIISSAMNIVGDPGVPRKDIVIMGGIKFRMVIQGNCHLQHLTLRQGWNGVFGRSSFTMEDVLVEQCGDIGVRAGGEGVVGRCTNVEVRQCGGSGVCPDYGASITLIGAKTTVYHNCRKGKSYHYGLAVYNSSFWGTTIQLVSPLTKEQVSFANGGGGNWGAENGADINQIKTIIEMVGTKPEAEVRVPEDYKTLKEAVDRVHGDDRLTTIVVGKGEHQIDGEYLEISSAMNIVGDPAGATKEEIVVVGGIWFEKGIQGNCHLQHLTLRQAWSDGVFGNSSFTMEEVLVEQCSDYGVVADGTGVVGRCTNVEVRQCESGGVWAQNGASITLIGGKTTVHHNCVDGQSGEYGLAVSDTSTIQLLAPLTKEIVSVDNGGGGNWGVDVDGGDINQIKTINE